MNMHNPPPIPFAIGDAVHHRGVGPCAIVEIDGDTVTITRQAGGEKKVVDKFLTHNVVVGDGWFFHEGMQVEHFATRERAEVEGFVGLRRNSDTQDQDPHQRCSVVADGVRVRWRDGRSTVEDADTLSTTLLPDEDEAVDPLDCSPRLTGRAGEIMEAMRGLAKIRPALDGQYLVKGWIDRGTLSVVYGESNVGKTFLALDLAMHVAAGMDWHGARVPGGDDRPGWVFYVAGEGGRGINNRIEALRLERADLIAMAEAEGSFTLLPTSLDLCADGDGEALLEVLEAAGSFPSLIVIDTLARAIGGGDENSGQDMGALIRNADMIRKYTDAHVMLIHHSGKDATRGARGHSSLRAAADTEIELTRADDVVMAETKKQRDIGSTGRFAYRLASVVIGQDEDGDDVTSAVVEPTEPVKRRPKIRGQALIAMQALDDALAHHGEQKGGDMFPTSRLVVSLDRWREYCDRHALSSGEGDSSRRTAFHKAKTTLHEKELIRVVDGFAWKVTE